MANQDDNAGMSTDDSNTGFVTLADLCIRLPNETANAIADALRELGIKSVCPLLPDENIWDGIFDAAAIEQLERHFARQTEPA